MWTHLNLFVSLIVVFSSSSHASISNSSSSSSCSIDFNYVNTFPWDPSDCAAPTATGNCCSTLRSLFGIGLSHHLQQNKTFYFQNSYLSSSCLSDFQSHLDLIPNVRQNFSACLTSANEFVANPSNCAGIMTASDWIRTVGPTPVLDSSCNGDLAAFLKCKSCLDAGMAVNTRLVSLNQNSTKCFEFTALYAAGIINSLGPDDIRTADCILGVSVPSSKLKSKSKSKKNVIFAIAGALIGSVVVLGVILMYRRYNYKKKEAQSHTDYVTNVKARVLPNTGAKWFGIAELDLATNQFSQQNFIGEGGFGVVYKGTLTDGTVVAVKKMTSFDAEADDDFVNEAEIISKIRHRNLLPLRGFCATSDPINGPERYLVYEFMPNGSLHDHIFNPKASSKRLSWPQRKSVILDVANGISYLHNGIKPAIFHRDIKATNILLDSNMKALVADFGLAKQNKDGQSHMTTRIAGTYGYVAPEYALYGQLTEKSDVYSFGIIILETMSGKKVLEEVKGVNPGMVLIADWAWELVKSGRIEEVFDSSMRDGTLPKSVMSRFVRVGLLCAHVMVAIRPTISEALKMLEGDIDIPPLLDRPPPLGHESARSSFQLSNSLWSSSQGSMFSSTINAGI